MSHIVNILLIIVSVMMTQTRVTYAQDPRANMPPALDPGHNAHQETVIYACMGVVAFMLAIACLLLWFLVDRSKRQIRGLKKILPAVVDKLRERAETVDDTEDSHGTLRATEFEAGFMTSSSVADNSLDYTQSRDGRQRNTHRNHAHTSQSASATRHNIGEHSANHVESSGHVRLEAVNPYEREIVRDTANQINRQGRVTSPYAHLHSRPVNRLQGPTLAVERGASQSDAPILQTFSQPAAPPVSGGGKAQELSSRVQVSVLSRPGRTGAPLSHAYDNPDAPQSDRAASIHDASTLPQQGTNSQMKLKYRNSYYESHV